MPCAIEELISQVIAEEVNERPPIAGEVAGIFERALRAPDEVQTEAMQSNTISADWHSKLVEPVTSSEEGADTAKNERQSYHVVYKYPLKGRAVLGQHFTIDLPEGAEVLCVQIQNGSPFIWAKVDPNRDPARRRFLLCGTGLPMEDASPLRYVGTFQLEDGAFVFHLFECKE